VDSDVVGDVFMIRGVLFNGAAPVKHLMLLPGGASSGSSNDTMCLGDLANASVPLTDSSPFPTIPNAHCPHLNISLATILKTQYSSI
jgi:hypothetical protein